MPKSSDTSETRNRKYGFASSTRPRAHRETTTTDQRSSSADVEPVGDSGRDGRLRIVREPPPNNSEIWMAPVRESEAPSISLDIMTDNQMPKDKDGLARLKLQYRGQRLRFWRKVIMMSSEGIAGGGMTAL